MEKEIWKDIPEYEGLYQVSSFGNLKSLERKVNNSNYSTRIVKEKIMKQSLSNNGYLIVSLWKNNKRTSKTVHSLVAMSFLKHIPISRKTVIDHIDNNKTNNKLSNIQIISNRENSTKDKIPKTGFTGVYYRKNKKYKRYVAFIRENGKQKYLGYFNTAKEAGDAYKKELININNK